MSATHSDKAALRGEPSYVWRAGQQRRLDLILQAAGGREKGKVLDNGCGLGMYLGRLGGYARLAAGNEYELERAAQAGASGLAVCAAAGEALPFPDNYFDLMLSHEVLEHVQDDRLAAGEMVRTLRSGGRLVLFCPNRGYPFETHGIYWRGNYRFGNFPLVNYLPRPLRDRLAPHVRVYSRSDLGKVFSGLPIRWIEQRVIASAYDNIIARHPRGGMILSGFTRRLEETPLRGLGLSHLWVGEKL